MAMLPPDPVYIFKGKISVSCVAFKIFEQVQRIYAGTHSGSVHIWDLKSKREIGSFEAGDDTCLSVSIPEEGDVTITQIKSGIISFWKEDGNQWALKRLLKINFFGFCKCQIFDNILYAPIKSSNCEAISVKSMERLDAFSLGSDNSAFEGLQLELWDLNEVKKVSGVQLSECPMAVDYDATFNKGLCGNPSDKILIFSLDKNLDLVSEKNIILKNPGAAAVRIRPDGKLFAVGCWDGKLRLYSLKSYLMLAALDIHSSTVEEVAFSENFRDGSKVKYLLAAGSKDSTVSLWDIYN